MDEYEGFEVNGTGDSVASWYNGNGFGHGNEHSNPFDNVLDFGDGDGGSGDVSRYQIPSRVQELRNMRRLSRGRTKKGGTKTRK
jgi:hypothetical protein